MIAESCGFSQPYLFRLFGTKKRLFLAAADTAFDRILEAWEEEAARHPGGRPPLCALGRCYRRLAENEGPLLMQLQAYAASSDDEIRVVVRGHWDRLRDYLMKAHPHSEDVAHFLANGLLINVLTALDVDDADPLWFMFEDESQHAVCRFCTPAPPQEL